MALIRIYDLSKPHMCLFKYEMFAVKPGHITEVDRSINSIKTKRKKILFTESSYLFTESSYLLNFFRSCEYKRLCFL